MKKGYKTTELGGIPEDWEVVKLGALSDIKRGLASHYVTYADDGVQLIRINDFQHDDPKYIIATTETKKLTLKAGDVLMAGTGATAGMSLLVNEQWEGLPFSFNVPRIRTKKNLDPAFLYFFLNTNLISEQQNRFFTGNAQPFLDIRAIGNLKIILPPLDEQRKIAAILRAVEEKLNIIASGINETQALKKGLMQQLLTKGIGHTTFKDSPLGKIPESWEVVSMGEITTNLDAQRIALKSTDREDVKGIYPYYGAQGIIDYIDKYIFDGEYLLVAEDGENVKSRKNDIAFIVNERFWLNNHAHILQSNERSNLFFLKYTLNFISILAYVTGQAQPKLNKSALAEIRILLPPLAEQEKIATILSTVDEKLAILQSKKASFQAMKKGLMQQLFTGKMRVI
ncbi:type I restriction enzyme S subunit [Chitinophaga niastensis]|uniref:Type I restriction enzyme S subunit n=1 Tax=Chitinophaga niastensis TaxID=536980 RepID=A0A2P8HTJ0_CHINA|nr:restriction endonuclease subunit S [Chitinophaga niastensis]PSL49484.1 type I restriction enzyme S subunit [Chitinophaga niastensis]